MQTTSAESSALLCLIIFVCIIFGYKKIKEVLRYNVVPAVKSYFYYKSHVNKVWSNILNDLMDAGIPLEKGYDYGVLGPVKFHLGGGVGCYGSTCINNNIVCCDLTTQKRLRRLEKRLREYEYLKYGVEVFSKLEKEKSND